MINRTSILARVSHDKRLLALFSGIIFTFIVLISLIVTAGMWFS
jgi:hypothetical protein